MKILYVEDSPEHIQTLRRITDYLKHTLITAETAHEGHARLNEHPDILLLDLTLPDMNGLDLARQVRAEGNNLPIIALTADAILYDTDTVQAAGCDAFLLKPYTAEQLMQMLERFASPRS